MCPVFATGHIFFIQRLKTSGGAVPATACTVGQTQLVPYTADYFFFRAGN